MRLITNFKAKLIASVLALGMIGSLIVPVVTHAAVVNPAPTAKVSFAFDDSLASAYTKAAPTLAKYGLTGTSYAITGCVGMTKVPNTCHANTDLPYMTWAQLKALQTTYHWEIGSHTVDHPCLASNAKADPSDCQTNTLTKAQVDAELLNSKTALANHGITATAFAPPYGDYSNMVMAQIAKYYTSMRGFKEQGTNGWPLDDYLLNNITVQQRLTPVATLESKIDQAISSNSWVILSFHDIAAKPSQNPDDYQYGTAELAQVAAYVQSKQAAGLIKNVNTSQGLVTSTTNMLPNGTFNDGVGDGWSTDDPIRITKDTASNGSYPDYTNSIKLVSNPNGKQTHLFSPAVSVNPNTTYLFKNFLNVQKISSGEVGFYVDEYDVNGSWISGQYLKRENSSFVEDMNFAYKPTSLAVAKASLQVVMAGTGITAYLDNSQMFALSTATPTQINLLPNGNFNAGIADGWSTDAAGNIVADGANHGSPSNPVYSVKMTAGTANEHLFSPLVSVSNTHSYTLSNYLNLQAISSGEVAFYIDEYDANGNWISGQYKLGVHTVSTGDVSLTYTPSSANVAKASLQVIVVGNSGITAYLDNSRWYQN